MKIKTLDTRTYASSPGGVSLSKEKLKMLRPDLYGIKASVKETIRAVLFGWSEKRRIKEHLMFCDSQPAIVVSKHPLVVAAYSDDIDCVVMLKFPDEYAGIYNLDVKSRLITINIYGRGESFQNDILPGESCNYTWVAFNPFIAEFLTDDIDILTHKKEQIGNEIWDYVCTLAVEYQIRHPNVWRDGRPGFSYISAL